LNTSLNALMCDCINRYDVMTHIVRAVKLIQTFNVHVVIWNALYGENYAWICI